MLINENSGEIQTNTSLHGLSAFKPYHLQILAMDDGNPQFTSSIELDIRVIETSSLQEGEEKGVKFISPSVDFILNVSEVRNCLILSFTILFLGYITKYPNPYC